MHRTPVVRSALAVLATLAIAACQDNPSPTAVDPIAPSANLQSAQGVGLPQADELDRQVPGFGGVFLDRDGSPTVYLTQGSSRAPAERALAGYLRGRGLSAAAVRVLEGQHGWSQLQRWQQDATEGAFEIEGTVFVDNDETSNRVRIGVENLANAGRVRAAVARLGVPDDAVIIERADPVVPLSSLQDIAQANVQAGVQINFPGYLCSVGFNAIAGNEQTASMITASHCTNKQGGVENTPYWQPLQSVRGTQIAVEVDDPAYTKNLPGCPKGMRVCRYSDASRARYMNGISGALGKIALTSGANNGSLNITGALTITSDDCMDKIGGCLTVGMKAEKVGRTTGWTSGNITNTCVNTGVSGTRIVQLCQTFVAAGVAGGDSGSDVFQSNGPDVKLVGILWGGGSGTFAFSPLANVVRELGTLTTH